MYISPAILHKHYIHKTEMAFKCAIHWVKHLSWQRMLWQLSSFKLLMTCSKITASDIHTDSWHRPVYRPGKLFLNDISSTASLRYYERNLIPTKWHFISTMTNNYAWILQTFQWQHRQKRRIADCLQKVQFGQFKLVTGNATNHILMLLFKHQIHVSGQINQVITLHNCGSWEFHWQAWMYDKPIIHSNSVTSKL